MATATRNRTRTTLTPQTVRTVLTTAGVPTRHIDVRASFTRKGAVTVTVPASRDCHGPSRMVIIGQVLRALDTAGYIIAELNTPTTFVISR